MAKLRSKYRHIAYQSWIISLCSFLVYDWLTQMRNEDILSHICVSGFPFSWFPVPHCYHVIGLCSRYKAAIFSPRWMAKGFAMPMVDGVTFPSITPCVQHQLWGSERDLRHTGGHGNFSQLSVLWDKRHRIRKNRSSVVIAFLSWESWLKNMSLRMKMHRWDSL